MNKINTMAAKQALSAAFNGYNTLVSCYYDKAPAAAGFPYSVIKNVHISPLNDGDIINFNLEIHTDDTRADSAEELEQICDVYRNAADGALLSDKLTFYGHINFNSQDDGALDAEYDLAHRTMSFSLRLFYF